MDRRKAATLVFTVLLAAACSGTPPAVSPANAPSAAPVAPAASPPPAGDAGDRLPNDVHWSRNAAEHRALYVQIYAQAGDRLEELARDRDGGAWAVALDADETVLDNSQYQKELSLAGLSFSQESWGAWVERREATPLPGAIAFLERVRELGGRIAIVTNRREALCPATEENFDRYSIPYDVILCRPPETSDKQPRWDRVTHGDASPDLPPLEIVLWLGDNIHDFPGLDQEVRHGSEQELQAFGREFFAFPNPMYGSWARNPPE